MSDIHMVMEDSAFSIMYRILGTDGDPLQQADVSAIEFSIYDLNTEELVAAAASLTVANVIYDTLQTDDAWTMDFKGYNFRHNMDHTVLTDPDRQYRFEYKFTLTGGEEVFLPPHKIGLNKVLSS